MGSANSKVISGLMWKIGERILAQGVSFVVSVILARVLMPEDYGIVAMVLIFITIADVFVSSGFSTALIQKKDSTEVDFSTMFICSLVVSFGIYILIFLIAPFVASFYDMPILLLLLRIFAIRIPLSVYNTIQHAYVSRHMLFKRFFFSTLFGTVISGIVGVFLAYEGYGFWALVAQYFTNTIVDTIILAITVPWKPRFLFSWKNAKELMNYGSKILLADLSGTFFEQLRNFVIGKVYTSSDLAFYNKGQQLPSLITTNISASIMAVLFPAISNEVDNISRVKQMTQRAIEILTYVMFPLLIGLAVIAEPLIIFIYTEKWSFCIPYVQLFSISSAVGMLTVTSLQSIKAIGRSDIVLKLEFIKKPIYIALLLIGVYKGVIVIAITMVIYEIYGTIMNMLMLKKYIGYSLKEQFEALFPALVLSLIMAMIVVIVPISKWGNFITLIIKICLGIIVYLLESLLIKPPAYKYIINVFIKKRKQK